MEKRDILRIVLSLIKTVDLEKEAAEALNKKLNKKASTLPKTTGDSTKKG